MARDRFCLGLTLSSRHSLYNFSKRYVNFQKIRRVFKSLIAFIQMHMWFHKVVVTDTRILFYALKHIRDEPAASTKRERESHCGEKYNANLVTWETRRIVDIMI